MSDSDNVPPQATREWLKQQVVDLFEKAKKGDAPDHAVCAKYLDLLFKLTAEDSGDPKPTASSPLPPGAAVRDGLWNQQQQAVQSRLRSATEPE